jgi:predicted nucleic acid-binding protein
VIVVDVNILAYRWLPGSRSQLADLAAQRDVAWAAPFLWRSEMRNVLAGYIRLNRLDESAALEILQKMTTSIDDREFQVSDAEVIALIRSSGCSAYDCEYAALAIRLGLPLLTEDEQLLTAFPRFAVSLENYTSS